MMCRPISCLTDCIGQYFIQCKRALTSNRHPHSIGMENPSPIHTATIVVESYLLAENVSLEDTTYGVISQNDNIM